jgi:Bardet-Biedl syndrome 9 protein
LVWLLQLGLQLPQHASNPAHIPVPCSALQIASAGVEHIVVQSYDGQLTFFEQEALAFSRFLPNFLLPGPLAYAAASDSFITSTAGLELVAYKYSNLAAASANKDQQQQGALYGTEQEEAGWCAITVQQLVSLIQIICLVAPFNCSPTQSIQTQ